MYIHAEMTHHLFGHHDDGLDGKASVAVIEQILQARTEQINDQDVVQALLAKVVHIGDARFYSQVSIPQHWI